MTITATSTSVTISYAATQAQLTKVLNNAAQYLYQFYPVPNPQFPNLPIPFETLTNAQKLAVIDQHVRHVIIVAARSNADALALAAAQADDQSLN